MSELVTSAVRSTVTRRGLLAASGAGLAALALGGCTGPTVGDSGEEADKPDVDWATVEPAKEISFWTNHPGNSMEIEQKFAEAFQEQEDIKVNIVTAGKNYEEVQQKFQTAQTGGEAGDMVVISDVTWFSYYLNKTIIPLDDLWKALEFEIDDYRDALIADYLYSDQHWGVPYSRSTPLFYYNKEHYEKAGLADAAPKTWQEYGTDHAPKLKEANGVEAAFAFPKQDQYPGWTLGNVIWGYGGAWSNEWDFSVLDGADTTEAMQWVQDAVQKQKWGMVASSDQAEAFAAGAVSTVVQSTGSLKGILETAEFDVGVGFLPGGPKETDPVCPTGGAGIGIARKSSPEKQLAAAKFLQFMTNPENSATFSKGTGYMPVRKSADMTDAVDKTPQLQVAVDQLDHTRPQDYARVMLPGGDLNISKMCQTVMTQDVDVKGELSSLRTKLEDTYNTDLKPKLGG